MEAKNVKTRMILALSAALIALPALLPRPTSGRGEETAQPIQYNHYLHTQELEIECVTCHRHVENGKEAGPPPLEVCLECHDSPITENPEEHKIQEIAESGTGISWVRLTFLPDHVYFSHRRHVAVGEIECVVCHGPMQMRTSPPRRPLKKLSMSACLDCHEEHGASKDCNSCHR